MSYSRAFGYSSGGGSSVVQLNPNIVPDTDADGNLISSSVTTTQLGYLNGVNAPIQTQLNTITGEITTLNSEVSTINGEITSINTSLAGKQATISLNNNIVPVTNSSGALTSSTVTSTTLGYLDATSSIQTQLNGKQAALSGFIPQEFIVATGSNTIGTTGLMIVSGSNIQMNTELEIVPSSSGRVLSVFNQGVQTILSVDTSGTLTSSQLNGSNLTASTALVSDSSNNIISSSTTSTELGYVHGVTSAIQTQLNSKQSALSGLTSGKHLVATGSSTIANSSIVSESGSNLTTAGNVTINPASDGTAFTVTNHAGSNIFNVNTSSNLTTVSTPSNNGDTFQVLNSSGNAVFGVGTTGPSAYINNDQGAYLLYANNSVATGYVGFGAPTYGSSTVYDNLYIEKNIMSPGAGPGSGTFVLGSTSRFFNSIYVNNIIGNGTILYNYNNSSAGTGYPTMDSVYTYEYIVTASSIAASSSPVGGFIPYPSGKSAANLRKLEASMYDGTYFVPAIFSVVAPAYAYAIAASPSGIFIETGSTWAQTSGSKTFYVWITTN